MAAGSTLQDQRWPGRPCTPLEPSDRQGEVPCPPLPPGVTDRVLQSPHAGNGRSCTARLAGPGAQGAVTDGPRKATVINAPGVLPMCPQWAPQSRPEAYPGGGGRQHRAAGQFLALCPLVFTQPVQRSPTGPSMCTCRTSALPHAAGRERWPAGEGLVPRSPRVSLALAGLALHLLGKRPP